MSKTVSFVARDELAEWLESKADEEMKTVSSLCQDIIAEEYRRGNQSEDRSETVFERYSDKWYRPDSKKHDFAVEDLDGDRRYYKTRRGAKNRLVELYER